MANWGSVTLGSSGYQCRTHSYQNIDAPTDGSWLEGAWGVSTHACLQLELQLTLRANRRVVQLLAAGKTQGGLGKAWQCLVHRYLTSSTLRPIIKSQGSWTRDYQRLSGQINVFYSLGSWTYCSVAEQLPSLWKALSLIPSLINKNQSNSSNKNLDSYSKIQSPIKNFCRELNSVIRVKVLEIVNGTTTDPSKC